MKRADLEHILRAAAAITDQTEFVVVGSQAALVQLARLPEVMALSAELDIYPRERADLADLIDASIGEGSYFHQTFGYYAQGIGPETAKLPRGWEARAVRWQSRATRGAVAVAPELHDLCASKLVAGREKDFAYVGAALQAGLIRAEELAMRIGQVPDVDPVVLTLASDWLSRQAESSGPG